MLHYKTLFYAFFRFLRRCASAFLRIKRIYIYENMCDLSLPHSICGALCIADTMKKMLNFA